MAGKWAINRAIEYLKRNPGTTSQQVAFYFKDIEPSRRINSNKKFKFRKLKHVPHHNVITKIFVNHDNVIQRKGRPMEYYYFIGDVSDSRYV